MDVIPSVAACHHPAAAVVFRDRRLVGRHIVPDLSGPSLRIVVVRDMEVLDSKRLEYVVAGELLVTLAAAFLDYLAQKQIPEVGICL